MLLRPPSTREQLASVPSVDRQQARHYGAAILAALQPYALAAELAAGRAAAHAAAATPRTGPRRDEAAGRGSSSYY